MSSSITKFQTKSITSFFGKPGPVIGKQTDSETNVAQPTGSGSTPVAESISGSHKLAPACKDEKQPVKDFPPSLKKDPLQAAIDDQLKSSTPDRSLATESSKKKSNSKKKSGNTKTEKMKALEESKNVEASASDPKPTHSEEPKNDSTKNSAKKKYISEEKKPGDEAVKTRPPPPPVVAPPPAPAPTAHPLNASGEVEAYEVLSNLFVGGQAAAEDLLELQEAVSHIVNLTKSVPNRFEKQFTYHRIDPMDGSDVCEHFRNISKLISTALRGGARGVLVHCIDGRSMSAAVAVAHLLLTKSVESLRVAYEQIASLQPKINIATQLLGPLMRLERELTTSDQNSIDLFKHLNRPAPTPGDTAASSASLAPTEKKPAAKRRSRAKKNESTPAEKRDEAADTSEKPTTKKKRTTAAAKSTEGEGAGENATATPTSAPKKSRSGSSASASAGGKPLTIPVPELPWRQGPFVLESLGTVDPNNAAFHNRDHIWPIGYRSTRMYASYKRPETRCAYTSEIVEKKGKPLFRVTCEDDSDHPIEGAAATAAWMQIQQKINDNKPKKTGTAVSGPFMFGLSHPVVMQLIERMPNAEKCQSYPFGRFGYDPEKGDSVDKPICITKPSQAGFTGRGGANAGSGKKRRRRRPEGQSDSEEEEEAPEWKSDSSDDEEAPSLESSSSNVSLRADNSSSDDDAEAERLRRRKKKMLKEMKEQMGYEDDEEEAEEGARKEEAALEGEENRSNGNGGDSKLKADRPSVRTTRKKILPPASLTKSASNLGASSQDSQHSNGSHHASQQLMRAPVQLTDEDGLLLPPPPPVSDDLLLTRASDASSDGLLSRKMPPPTSGEGGEGGGGGEESADLGKLDEMIENWLDPNEEDAEKKKN